MAGKSVVVVGGGPGGLCAAMLLASRGFHVTLLEKQAELGGRSGALQLGPYTFDIGSTMLMMRFVFEELFELVGRRFEQEVQLVPLEPMYRLDFGPRALDVFAHQGRMEEELRRFSPGSEAGLAQFLSREHARLTRLYPVLQRSWPGLLSLLSPTIARALPLVGIGHSLHASAADYFDDEALRLGFSFQSAYLGMSPWECPGGFAMVPYVEHAWGLDHVQGGIHQVCEALARVARSLGTQIRTLAPVKKLLVSHGRCTGVELMSGERLEADDVILNADASAALLRMLDQDISLYFSRAHIAHQHESCSTYMLYLGLDTQLPIGHHTFFFSDDYRAEMDRVFKTGALDEDLSLYVCNPARSDGTMAPEGHSSLYLLALVPNTRIPIDWREEAPRMRQRVLGVLERRVGVPIEAHVRAERWLTPEDWAHRYEVSHGAVFGPAHTIDQLLAFRLPNHLPSPEHVYLVGGSTNPGSGLPTILESARIATRLLCEAYGMAFPASRPLPTPTWCQPTASSQE